MRIKRFLPVLLTVMVVLGYSVPAMACTGLYVGGDYSQNGSTYFGRSEDLENNGIKIFGVQEAKDWPEGTVYTDNDGFSMPMPTHTFRYSYMRDSKNFTPAPTDNNGNVAGQAYGEVGMNEKGVSVSATVSTRAGVKVVGNKKAGITGADPLVDGGITEISLGSILLGISESARDGVEKLAAIIDKYGAGENNSLMIGDTNEVWYVEILSGHQYAAVRMPADKVSVQPNMILMGAIDVNDKKNVIVSPNLVKLAEDNGFLVKDESGKIDVALTYRGTIAESQKGNGNLTRYWMAGNYLNSALFANESLESFRGEGNQVKLLFDADRKLTTAEVLGILKQRGIGTKYDHTKDNSIYPVGNENQMEVHVFEKRTNKPLELTTVQWQGMADAPYTIFIPYYTALMSKVNPKYEEDGNKTYIDGSIHWLFNDLNDLCMQNYSPQLEKGVREYLDLIQNSLIEQQVELDVHMQNELAKGHDKAQAEANRLGIEISDQVYDLVKTLRDEVKAYINNNDTSKEFVASGFTSNLVPKYNFIKEKPNGKAEIEDSDDSTKTSGDVTHDNVTNNHDKKNVKTGDRAPITILIIVVVIAVIALIVTLIKRRK